MRATRYPLLATAEGLLLVAVLVVDDLEVGVDDVAVLRGLLLGLLGAAHHAKERSPNSFRERAGGILRSAEARDPSIVGRSERVEQRRMTAKDPGVAEGLF